MYHRPRDLPPLHPRDMSDDGGSPPATCYSGHRREALHMAAVRRPARIISSIRAIVCCTRSSASGGSTNSQSMNRYKLSIRSRLYPRS